MTERTLQDSQRWHEKANAAAIDDASRRRIVGIVRSRLGWTGAARALGICQF